MIRKLADQALYKATRLVYNGGKQVEYVLGEQWTPDGQTVPCNQYSRTYVRRYRYDSPRQRYMRQKLDPTNITTVLETSWSDYDGNEVYTDFNVTGGTHAVKRSYQTGFGEFPEPANPTSSIQYYQGDLIGSTRTMTCETDMGACTPGPQGEPPITRRRVYTAFGEMVSSSGTQDSRYRYAGGSGYQSHDDFPFLHVESRWYDPESGRLLQRDPMGIFGGLNVYAYVGNSPIHMVDPTGNGFLDGGNWFHEWIARNVWMRVHDTQTLAEMSDGRAYTEAIGASVVIGAGGYFAFTYAGAWIGGQAGWVGVRAGIARGGLHFTVGSGSGWVHYVGIKGFMTLTAVTGAFGRLIFWFPARYPGAISAGDSSYNCLTGVFWAVIRAL